MQSNYLSKESKSDKVVAILLATFSMFVVGYTATRVFLDQGSNSEKTSPVNVIPHQSSLWSDLGK